MTTHGFGIAGALDRSIIAALAGRAEGAGYQTFWTNDTEEGDGLDAVRAALATTSTIRFGVGVIPIDRVSSEEIAARITEYGLPENRLTVGIGSGSLKAGALQAVRDAASGLAKRTTARVVIGALGPNMVRLAVSASDGVLLNWLTPDYAAASTEDAHRMKPTTWVAAYVRVGLTGKGADAVMDEGRRYAAFPAYGAHFKRMGAMPEAASAFGDPDAIAEKLALFDGSGIDETVVRAVAEDETFESYLDVLMAAAPNG